MTIMTTKVPKDKEQKIQTIINRLEEVSKGIGLALHFDNVEINGDDKDIFIQPRTTSTDIEELKKEFFAEANKDNCLWEHTDSFGGTEWDSVNYEELWDFVAKLFAPHLSNKSELKKEAVREFAKWLDDNNKDGHSASYFVDGWCDLYLSSNEKEVSK